MLAEWRKHSLNKTSNEESSVSFDNSHLLVTHDYQRDTLQKLNDNSRILDRISTLKNDITNDEKLERIEIYNQ